MLAQLSFLLLPVAATAGWIYGRWPSRRHHSAGGFKLQHDYFKGLNYLINEQPDKAVDVFIKLLEVDSDTVDMHLAIGNLFRRRGEVDRAIRVHQNIIARPQLHRHYRVQALSALGRDYLRAGVLDRAERLFQELVDLGEEHQSSLRFLLRIYEQEKDWSKAIETAQKLQVISQEDMRVVIAEYYCELAQQAREQNDMLATVNYLKRAHVIDPRCVRASIIRGQAAEFHKNYAEAIRWYQQVIAQDPDYLSEIVKPLGECYRQIEQENKFIGYAKRCLQAHPRISLVLAISDYLQREESDEVAISFVAEHIKAYPSLRGLSHLISLYLANAFDDTRDKLEILQDYIEMVLRDKPFYRCHQCGFSALSLFWLCPSCQHWNTVKPVQGLLGS